MPTTRRYNFRLTKRLLAFENRCTHCLAFSHASAILPTGWHLTSSLMLNSDKTELLGLNACHLPRPAPESITVDVIHALDAVKAVKNIGVWFDEFLPMDKPVKAVCKSAFFHLPKIAKIRKYITSKLNYCNSLLSGFWLQLVQNSAARLLTGTRKHEHISPMLRFLPSWLPIPERINWFKLLLLI